MRCLQSPPTCYIWVAWWMASLYSTDQVPSWPSNDYPIAMASAPTMVCGREPLRSMAAWATVVSQSPTVRAAWLAVTPDPGSRQGRTDASRGVSLYVLLLLTLLHTLSLTDRFLIAAFGTQISLDLGLSNQQFGFVTGLAFTLFYATTGPLAGLMVDRFGPGRLLGLGVLVWSAMTGLTGIAKSFTGLWLPRSHAEAPSDVSALLSGVVVTGGAAPLLHLAAVDGSLLPLLRTIGLCSAGLGILQALTAPDLKRLLAWSTVSQMGLVVLSPITGGAVALAHGLAKAPLFLMAGHVQERQLLGWQERALPLRLQLPLWIGSLSIAGAPLLAGFSAKKDLDASLPAFWAVAATLTSIGSVALFARLWGAPLQTNDTSANRRVPWGSSLLLLAVLVGGLLGVAQGLLTPVAAGETALLFAAGLGIHLLLKRPRQQIGARLPQLESLQDLIGNIAVVGAALLLAVNLMEARG